MIARASQLFLPTLRDAPADAEAVSHKLLVRGGFIRQVSARACGRSCRSAGASTAKIEQIIREEMDAIGGQEMLMPVLTPAELWEATGRIGIPEIFHARGPDRPPTSSSRSRTRRRSRSTRGRSSSTSSCRSSGTTSRRRTATSRARAAGSSASASSS